MEYLLELIFICVLSWSGYHLKWNKVKICLFSSFQYCATITTICDIEIIFLWFSANISIEISKPLLNHIECKCHVHMNINTISNIRRQSNSTCMAYQFRIGFVTHHNEFRNIRRLLMKYLIKFVYTITLRQIW